MAAPDTGYLDRPNYSADGLYSTLGEVRMIWVEQEDAQTTVKFRMWVWYLPPFGDRLLVKQDFMILLDVNTWVAMAQLTLLRDALRSVQQASTYTTLAHVHFNFSSSSQEFAYVYSLRLVYDRELVGRWTVQEYSNGAALRGAWHWQ